jgi:penicillin-binding protein 2
MDLHRNRKFVYIGLFSLIALVYLIQIFRLQVLDNNYEQKAINNALNKIPIYPDRSIIYDRNGKLLVHNIAIYDLIVFPAKAKFIDTAAFCDIMKITGEEYHKYMSIARENSKKRQKNNVFNGSAVFMSNLTKDQYSAIQENLYRFPVFLWNLKQTASTLLKGVRTCSVILARRVKNCLEKTHTTGPVILLELQG